METFVFLLAIVALSVPIVAWVAFILALKLRRELKQVRHDVESLRVAERTDTQQPEAHSKSRESQRLAEPEQDAPEPVTQHEVPSSEAAFEPPPPAFVSPPEPAAPSPPPSEPKLIQPQRPMAAPVEPPRKSALKAALQRVGLWPPESDASLEMQLGAWWAARIGALLLVITGVFFAIYVSAHAQPWVRLAELGLAALGVCGLAQFLEKKLPGLARALLPTGLTLTFLTAMAAYAFEPTRVLESLVAAVVLQSAVAVGIAGVALWKRREDIALLAVVLGYVASWFSFGHDLGNGVWVGSSLFALIAFALYGWRGWQSLPLAAITGIVPLYFADAFNATGFLLSPTGSWWSLPLSLLLLGWLADNTAHLRHDLNLRGRRLMHLVLVGGFAAMGFALPLLLKLDRPLDFALAATLLLLGYSVFLLLRKDDAYLRVAYFLKGCTFLTLFILMQFDGPVRPIALALQAVAMLYSLRHYRSRWTESGMVIVWLIGLIALLNAVFTAPLQYPLLLGTVMVFILLSGLWTGLWGRIMPLATHPARAYGQMLLTLGLALLLPFIFAKVLSLEWQSWALLFSGTLFAATALLLRHLQTWAAAFAAYLLSVLIIWLPMETLSSATAFSSVIIILVGVVGISGTRLLEPQYRNLIHGVLFACGTCALLRLIDGLLPASYYGIATVAMSLSFFGLAAVPAIRKATPIATVIFLPPVLGLFLLYTGLPWADFLELRFNLLSGLVLLALVELHHRITWLKQSWPGYDQLRDGLYLAISMLFVGIAAYLVNEYSSQAQSLWILLFSGIIYTLVGTFGRARLGLPAGQVVNFLLLALLTDFAFDRQPPTIALSMSFAVAASILANAWLELWRSNGKSNAELHRYMGIVGLVFVAFPSFYILHDAFALKSYATAIWGALAITLLICGFLSKISVWRTISLGTLVCCLVRLFSYDISDTFHRIIAFAGVAVVLILVGFIYSRFRGRIE